MSDRPLINASRSTRRQFLGKSAMLAGSVAGGLMLADLIAACSNSSNSGSGVKLTYLNWQSDDSLKSYLPSVQSFVKAHPGITMTTPNYPDVSAYLAKLNSLLAAGTPPDLFISEAYQALDYGAQGALLDVVPYYDQFPPLKNTLDELKLYWAPGKSSGSANFVQTLQLFYSKSAFTNAGLPVPPSDATKAWTWDEFVQVARHMTVDTKGKRGDESGFDSSSIKQYGLFGIVDWWYAYYPLLLSAGAELVDSTGEFYTLNTGAAVDAIQKMSDLITKYHVTPSPQHTQGLPTGPAAVANGTCAMLIDGQWECGYFPPLTSDWGVGVLPIFVKPVTAIYPQAVSISSKTPHAKEAVEFLSWFSDPVTNSAYKIGNIMPPVETAYKDPAQLASWTSGSTGRPPEYKAAVVDYLLNYGVPIPLRVKNFFKITNALQAALDPVWIGQKSPQQALNELANTIKPMLQGAYPSK